MHLEVHGDSTHPAVLLLHGGGIAGWMWDHQVQALGETYQVLVPDLPGHGASADETYRGGREVADELAGIIRNLPPRNGKPLAAVVGFSLGGQHAVDLASRYPELVDKVVVVSSLSSALVPGTWLPGFTGWLMAASRRLAVWRPFARLQARNARIPEERFEQYFETSKAISADTLRGIGVSNMAFRVPDGWGRVPSLLVAGSQEDHALHRSMEALHRRAEIVTPGSHAFVVMDGVSHGAPYQDAETFNRLLLGFLTCQRPGPKAGQPGQTGEPDQNGQPGRV